MTPNDGSLSPMAYARELRWELGLGTGRIEPKAVCARLGIRYVEKDLGASGWEAGALLRGKSGRLAVVANSSIRYESRRRFTAAHELGHARITAHHRAEYWCVADDIESYRAIRQVEKEANEFAAELLLPEVVVTEKLGRRAPAMDLVRDLAREYGTSLTATACKIVSLAPDPCAVSLSNPEGVLWIVASCVMRSRYTLMMARRPLSPDSVAADAFSGISVPEVPQRVSPRAWLTGWRDEKLDYLQEEAIVFSDLGLVLSFVTVPEDTDPEETEW